MAYKGGLHPRVDPDPCRGRDETRLSITRRDICDILKSDGGTGAGNALSGNGVKEGGGISEVLL